MATYEKLTAIEIDSLETWEMICALQPHYKELNASENRGNFVVVSSEDPKLEGAIIPPGAVAKHFDHIETDPGRKKVKFVALVREVQRV